MANTSRLFGAQTVDTGMHYRRRLLTAALAVVLALPLCGAAPAMARVKGVSTEVLRRLRRDGRARVIVQLAPKVRPEGILRDHASVAAQRLAVAAAQESVLAELAGTGHELVRRFTTIPFMALDVDAAALEALERSGAVVRVDEDRLSKPSLAESVPLVQADQAWSAGYDGRGSAVAVLDTGVDVDHSFLAGKVVSEACFSSTGSCPNGEWRQIGAGAGAPCTYSPFECMHGTHVAGIIAGAGALGAPSRASDASGRELYQECVQACGGVLHRCLELGKRKPARQCARQALLMCAGGGPAMCSAPPPPAGSPVTGGVAKGAQLIAIQVFSRFDKRRDCGRDPRPCVRSRLSDQLAALEHVLSLRDAFHIAAVNMSLGGGRYTSQADCDAANGPMKQAIDHLRSVGIATVLSSGNDGNADSLQEPACISTAISVGATTKDDAVAEYSNSAPFLQLLAPGSGIDSSIPGGGFAAFDGTSMAAPHVAGAWAVLKEKVPSASVDEILNALRSTGLPVADGRNGLAVPRIQVAAALGALHGTTTTTTATTTTTTTTIAPPGTCPAGYPVDCGTYCCRADYPVCYGGGCLDCDVDCGNGKCCPSDFPVCASDGYCHAQ